MGAHAPSPFSENERSNKLNKPKTLNRDMELKWLGIYNKDAWERMVAESCGSQFTDAHCQRIFKKKYAVCIETDSGKDAIIHWTDERDYPLKDGQFLVDDGTRTVVEDEGLKERFEELHQRLRDLS